MTTLAVAQKVIVGTMTSSPGPTSIAASDRCSAAVQELTAIACLVSTYSAHWFSNCFTFGPVVIQPERSVSTTSAMAPSSIRGRAYGRKLVRIGESLWFGSAEDGDDGLGEDAEIEPQALLAQISEVETQLVLHDAVIRRI